MSGGYTRNASQVFAVTDGGGNPRAPSNSEVLTWTQEIEGYVNGKLQSVAGLGVVAGDVLYGSGAGVLARLPKGTNGQVLTLAAGLPAWADVAGGGGGGSGSINVPMRQTALSGPSDSNGYPSFYPASSASLTLTLQNLSSTSPLVLALGNGLNASGQVDVVVTLTANASITLPASNTSYIYVDDTGALGSTTTAPLYQRGGAISITAGQHAFDELSGTMWLGNGSTASAVRRVFIAEAVTSGTATTTVRCYAYQRDYLSTQQTITAAGSLTLDHNIGRIPRRLYPELVCVTAEQGYSVGDAIPVNFNAGDVGSRATTVTYTATQALIRFSNVATVFSGAHKTSGALVALTNANWRLRLRAVA